MSSVILLALVQGCQTVDRVDRKTADERYKLVSDNLARLATGGSISRIEWSEDGSTLSFNRGRERCRFDLNQRRFGEVIQQANEDQPASRPRRGAGGTGGQNRTSPGRGKQRDREKSPDGKWTAICKDWNVNLQPEDEDDAESISVTTDGQRKFRYGTASWVYGEELDQHEALWWSPDSTKLAFYEFDEREVPDHFIAAGLTDLHTHVLTEGYPKPGEPNPIANLLIHHLASGETIRVQPADDPPNWYTYAVQFAPDGSELLFNRTNRRQDVMQVVAADLETGETRIVLTETQATWQNNAPEMKFLKDNRRFIWATERTGWKQYELRNLDGELLATLTQGDDPAKSIIKLDEDNCVLFYTAFSDSNPLNAQLHKVGLDGKNQKRLTEEHFNHAVQLSNDSKWFTTEYESVETPPTTALYDANGNRIATLAKSDDSKFKAMGMEKPELFKFKADDGKTDIYGVLYKPSNFSSSKKYPLVVDVYGGPLSQSVRNNYTGAKAACEYGFLIAQIDNRGTQNRGKAFEAAAYMKLGDVDVKDQADGVRFLTQRSYVDARRIGICGHSYGGYMSALALLKYPDVFAAASAGGTVSDWRNYDSIYTERFMRTPQENPEGYDVGSCMKHVDQLKGKLLLLHGMVDDNVHANNAWQLIDALQKAGKSFEMMFYPDSGHSLGGNANTMRWNFLRRVLIEDYFEN